MGYRNAAAKLGCADPLACNRTTIMGLMEAEERAGHEDYYRSIFCRFNLGCAWQFGFNTDFVTPNAVISNAGYWFVGLLILVTNQVRICGCEYQVCSGACLNWNVVFRASFVGTDMSRYIGKVLSQNVHATKILSFPLL